MTTKTKPLHEVFASLKTVKKEETLIRKLQEADSFALRTLLQGNFDPNITFGFPEGEPPFEKLNDEVELTRPLINLVGMCHTGARGNAVGKEVQFIKFLEKINRRDAALFVLMKDRALEKKFPFLTEDLVRKAFPNLLPPKVEDDTQTLDDSPQ